MKRFASIVVLLLINSNIFCADNQNGKVIIYRENNYHGSAASYKVSANDSLLIRIRNSTYFIFNCPSGEYRFKVNNFEYTSIKLDVEKGKTYYLRLGFRVGFWSSLPELILVDSISAYKVIDSGKLRLLTDYNEYLDRPKNRVGLALNMGFGFESIPMIVLENGGNSDISFGGGMGVGISYGYEVNKLVDISFAFFYKSITLVPNVSNANIQFSSLVTRITPSLIIPIEGGYSMRFKLGAGINYNAYNRLSHDTQKIQNGIIDTWHYKNTMGPHAMITYEISPVESWTLSYGLYLYKAEYKYLRSDRLTYPIDNKLINGDGTGLDYSVKLFYNF